MATNERTGGAVVDAPDAPVDPAVAGVVDGLLRRPYRMVVRGEPEEGYLAEAPELPGCVTAGETPEEALALLRDAMRSWLVVAVEGGHAIPDPLPDPPRDYSGRFVLRLPKSLHRLLAERAEAEGVSLNQLALTILALGLGAAPSALRPRG
jgi:antitoxin HicB